MSNTPIPIAVIGAGPAGLMAAEVLSAAGISVHVFDAMPSVGRKFLLAGIGGLNLTHAEPFDVFTTRFGERATACANWLQGFDAQAIREWAKGLGIDTFVGSSQRVFPTDMKAAPLLRAWLHRLRHPQQGEPVRFHMRHRWNGNITRTDTSNTPTWQLAFDTPHGLQSFHAHVVLMALGVRRLAGCGFGGLFSGPAHAWLWYHKTIFSLLSWLCFATLLFGRTQLGWRGRTAVRVLYAGTGLLLLAYVGSRFVLEVVLDRLG